MRSFTILALGTTALTLAACAPDPYYATAESYCENHMNYRVGTPAYQNCVTTEKSQRADWESTHPGQVYTYTTYSAPASTTVVTTTTTSPAPMVDPAPGTVVEQKTYYTTPAAYPY